MRLFSSRNRRYRQLALELSLLTRYLADKCQGLESQQTIAFRWIHFLLEKDKEFIESQKTWSQDQRQIFEGLHSRDPMEYGRMGALIGDYDIDSSIDSSLELIGLILESLSDKKKD